MYVILFSNLMHYFFIKSIVFPTCFEQYYAHLQEDLMVCIQHLVPDFVTLLRGPFGVQVKRGLS